MPSIFLPCVTRELLHLYIVNYSAQGQNVRGGNNRKIDVLIRYMNVCNKYGIRGYELDEKISIADLL